MRRILDPNRDPLGAGFVAALTVSMGFGSLHTYVVGFLAPFWQSGLGLTAVQVGAVATAVVLVAAAASVVAGSFVDAWGGRRLLLALYALVALGLVTMATAPSMLLLLVGAAFGGLAQAISNPATNQLIAVHMPLGKRGSSVGIKQSGVQASGFVVGLVVPSVSAEVGWRPVLAAAAVVAAVVGLVSLVLVPSGRPAPVGVIEPTQSVKGGRFGSVAALGIGAFFVGAGVVAVLTYTPLYAVSLGASPKVGGLVVSLTALLGVVGRVAWAAVAERVRDVSRVLTLLGFVALLSAVMMPLASVAGIWLLWVAGAVHGLSASAWNAPVMVAVIRALPQSSIGRGTGAVQTAFLAGLVSSPLLVGWVVDSTGGYSVGWGIVALAFVCATVSTWWWRVAAANRPPAVS